MITILGIMFIGLALVGFASDRLGTTEHLDMATAVSSARHDVTVLASVSK